MNIDLHMHSHLSNQRGDSVTFYSIDQTVRQLLANGVKYFSFTEHDKFSCTFIDEVKEYISSNNIDMKLLPGVEMTINKKDNSPGHILFIFKEHKWNEKIEEIVKKIAVHYNCKMPSKGLDLFIGALDKNNIEYVIIPHLKKSNGLVYEDASPLFWNKVKYVESTSFNTKSFRDICEKTKQEMKEVYFSDTHHWREYRLPTINSEEVINELKEDLNCD